MNEQYFSAEIDTICKWNLKTQSKRGTDLKGHNRFLSLNKKSFCKRLCQGADDINQNKVMDSVKVKKKLPILHRACPSASIF